MCRYRIGTHSDKEQKLWIHTPIQSHNTQGVQHCQQNRFIYKIAHNIVLLLSTSIFCEVKLGIDMGKWVGGSISHCLHFCAQSICTEIGVLQDPPFLP